MYSVYGLNIESEIPLPGLAPARGGPRHVTIRRQRVPGTLVEPTWSYLLFEAKPGEYLFKFDRVANMRILAIDGETLAVDLDPEADADVARNLVLSCGLTAILHQRRVLPIHANAIETDAGAVLLAGTSGIGKTTLCREFMRRGYRVMSDDISAVELRTDGPVVRPGLSRLKLRLSDAPPESGLAPAARPEKVIMPVASDLFCSEDLPLAAIYVLSASGLRGIGLTPVEGLAKLDVLVGQQYGVDYLPFAAAMDQISLWRLASSLDNLAIRLVRRPWGLVGTSLAESVSALADVLEADFRH